MAACAFGQRDRGHAARRISATAPADREFGQHQRHDDQDEAGDVERHEGAAAVGAALGFVVTGVAVVDQGVEVDIGNRPHMAATAAIATVRSAKFLVFFVAERSAAIAAVARSDVDERFVYKFHGDCTRKSGDAHSAPGCRRLHH